MTSKSKLYIMLMLHKPQKSEFQSRNKSRQRPNPNSVLHICATYPQSMSYFSEGTEQLGLDPKGAPLLSAPHPITQ